MAWSENGAVDTINNLSSSGGDTVGFTASKLKWLHRCGDTAADRPVTNQTTAEMSFPARARRTYLGQSLTNMSPCFDL